MRIPEFRPAAATELASHILLWLGGKADRITILKLLYQVERRALERYNWPVMFDRLYCLPMGTVPQSVYDLMKEIRHDSPWPEFISAESPHHIRLRKEPKLWQLSEAQLELAREVVEENRHKQPMQLSQENHELPEWSDPQGSSYALSYPTLLKHLGKSDAEIEEIFNRLDSEAAMEDLLA